MTDDRTPPQDLDAERSVLGAMMLSKHAVPDVLDTLDGRDFYRPAHELIFDAMGALHAKGDPVDAVTVLASLVETGTADKVGGAPYLHTLANEVPTATNADYYARLVADVAKRRRLVNAGARIQQLGYTTDGTSIDELVENARSEVDATSRATAHVTMLNDLVDPVLNELEDPTPAGLPMPSPWEHLDYFTGGFRRGCLYVIGARPAVGKSIVGVQAALSLARHGNVAISSLEMTSEEIVHRVMSQTAEVALGRLNGSGTERLTAKDWTHIAEVRSRDLMLPLAIDERSSITPTDIRSHARSVARRDGGIAGVVVDYLQLMSTPRDMKGKPRHEVVGEFSRSLKLLAKELDCPVIALSQLNRNSASESRRPTMSDLRESGSVEQDADVILLLHQDGDITDNVDLMVEKNRHGPAPRTVELDREGHYARMVPRRWRPRFAEPAPDDYATRAAGGDR